MLTRSSTETVGLGPIRSAVPIVGIGGGRGGAKALQQMLSALPAETGRAFVFLGSESFTRQGLATLSKSTPMPVVEITAPTPVRADHFYVAPPDTDVELQKGVLYASKVPSPDLRIDRFLQSVAADQHAAATGVLLSGAACDGVFGLDAIKAKGGITFVQKPESAERDGMPRAAMATGKVDFVLSPTEIANGIARILHPPGSEHCLEIAGEPVCESAQWPRLFALLRSVSGIDFTYYRKASIKRRIARRMAERGFSNFGEYVTYLDINKGQAAALAQDFLIPVTEFFREPGGFEALQRHVFPVWHARDPAEAIRVWVAGCSSGEEAYSIGMCLLESLGDSPRAIRIFATDVNEVELEKARAGVYPAKLLEPLSQDRLRRFFHAFDGKQRVVPELRDLCVFSRHDLTQDPPLPRIDLVSCRNVLIYMEPVLQRKVLESAHYALKPGGFLLLGKSEDIGAHVSRFSPADWKNKLFRKA